ncbi:MAG: tripartite tricarboxylate transporter TctB family protein [Micromonosporaceae bacterium]
MPSPSVDDRSPSAGPERGTAASGAEAGAGQQTGAASAAGRPGAASLAWSSLPSLIAFLLAAVFLLRANTITGPEAAYPVVLAAAILLVGMTNLVRDVRAVWRPHEREGEPAEPTAVGATVAFVVVLLAALVLLQPLGFFCAMAVMVVGSLLAFGVRDPLVLAAATVLIVGWSYVLFVRVLSVPFPPGPLGLT